MVTRKRRRGYQCAKASVQEHVTEELHGQAESREEGLFSLS